jgi:molybdopterin synthase catalytic subunit
MADSGTGIQELMAAETRASQIVAEARIGEFNRGEDGVLVTIMKRARSLAFDRCTSVVDIR